MMPSRADEAHEPGCPECDVQWNSVAVSSVAYQQEVGALSVALGAAYDHGLSVADLVAASGLPVKLVLNLLGGASL
jgi:hypothetical protein